MKFRDGKILDWTWISNALRKVKISTRGVDLSIWTEWVNAEDCSPFVIESEGSIVGIANLRKLGLSEWWLEGINVIEANVIKTVVRAAIEKAENADGGVIRIALDSMEHEIQPVLDEMDFFLQGEYVKQHAQAYQSSVENFFPLKPENAGLAYQFLRHSPLYRTNRYIYAGEQWPYLTEDRLKMYLEPTNPVQVLGWNAYDTLNGIAILHPNVGEEMLRQYFALYISFISAPDDTTLQYMLESLLGIAARMGKKSVIWQMPLGAGVDRAVEKSGYERDTNGQTHIYEYMIRS